MAAGKKSFDECFQAFPELNPPENLRRFWQNALDELKKIPVSPRRKLLIKKSIGMESRLEISFLGFGTHTIQAYLSIPRKRKKVPAIISFHDYGGTNKLNSQFTESGFAHLAVILRGHKKTIPAASGAEMEIQATRHFDAYGLDTVEESYPFACILDAVRAVDLLRLEKEIDSSNIGIIGNGFGASLAVFAAVFKKENVKAIVLERPGFIWLPSWLRESGSHASMEINEYTRKSRAKSKIKKNLEFLDPLNLTEQINIPVMTSVCMEDSVNPPLPAFGFFNRLKTEKIMELYPEESSDPEQIIQRKKSIDFIKQIYESQNL